MSRCDIPPASSGRSERRGVRELHVRLRRWIATNELPRCAYFPRPTLCYRAAMTTPTCPKCNRTIPGDDINVANDLAFCRACNVTHKLSELTITAELEAGVRLDNPPAGAWRRNDGIATVIGATHRSIPGALGALAFGLFWNGIVSVFVLVALAATLKNLGITPPHWFPAPVMNGSGMGVGITIFLWISSRRSSSSVWS